MIVTPRSATPGDATAWADVVASCSPYLVQDATSTAYEMTTEGPGTQRLVTEVHGEILGISRLRADPGEDHVSLMVMVRPERRRLGLGRALLDAQLEAAARTGRPMVTCIVEDDEEARIACTRWGFTMTRSFRMAMVDPRSTPEPPAAPDGTSVVPLTALGPRVVWRAHAAVVGDDPSGLSLAMPYDEFLAHEWADPRMRPDLGRAVLVGGELASFTMVGAASDRAWSDMTGTLPAHRGQGLALLAKWHALRAAAAAGITRAIAGNDDANTPMVAVNDRLGYRPFASPSQAQRPIVWEPDAATSSAEGRGGWGRGPTPS